MFKVFFLFSCMFCKGIFLSLSFAQISTSVISDGTLGTIVHQNGNVFTITGGNRPGNGANLFHSFRLLSVAQGDTANFFNNTGSSTTNIFGRVTGGQVSNIFGTIQTTGFPGANLFLLNPGGIVFGPNAALNVSGSVHISTADFLELVDGTKFEVNHKGDSPILTSASVKSFGFLNPNPNPIEIKQSQLQLPEGKTFSLIGGNINILGGQLKAPSGGVILASLAAPGTVEYASQNSFKVNASKLGKIELSRGASISANGRSAGIVKIQGGRLRLDQSTISANSSGESDVITNSKTWKGIDIFAKEEIAFQNGSLIEANVESGSMNGGEIVITTPGDIDITDSTLHTLSNPGAAGNAGDISIYANKISLLSNVFPAVPINLIGISSITFGDGNAGNIQVAANSLHMEGGFIASVTIGGGDAGNLTFSLSEDMAVVGNSFGGNVVANTFGSGNGGIVDISARNLSVVNDSQIQSSTGGPGNAKAVNIKLTGLLDIQERSSIDSFTNSAGDAGDVNIIAKEIFIKGVSSGTDPTSIAGDFTGISSDSTGPGKGGNISITSGNLKVVDKGFISSNSSSSANAGNISIDLSGDLTLQNGGQLRAITRDSGNAGNINIGAKKVLISGRNLVPFREFNGSQRLAISQITSASEGAGNAGDISIAGNEITIEDGAAIVVTSDLSGKAGNIKLFSNGSINLQHGTVSAAALNSDGGNIKLTAPNTIRLVNSQISTSVGGGPNTVGGNINIDPQFVILQNSQVIAQAAQGQGGAIDITTQALLTDSASVIDASSQFGVSGTVNVQSPTSNISQALSPLSEEALSVAALLRARCAARKQEGSVSSFTEQGRDMLPVSPGTLIPSPLFLESVSSDNSISDQVAQDQEWMKTVTFEEISSGDSEQYVLNELVQGCLS